MGDDASLQVDEGWDPAAAGPPDPGLEGVCGFVVGQLEHQPETFLEQVRPVQPRIGLGDPRQFRLLAAGWVADEWPLPRPGYVRRDLSRAEWIALPRLS